MITFINWYGFKFKCKFRGCSLFGDERLVKPGDMLKGKVQ
jgi:hypothetical protein